jgi:La-related protein 7
MHETDGNSEDVSTLNHSNEKQFEQSSQLLDVLLEHSESCRWSRY